MFFFTFLILDEPNKQAFRPLVELINFIASSGCKDPDAKIDIAVTWFDPFFIVLKNIFFRRIHF